MFARTFSLVWSLFTRHKKQPVDAPLSLQEALTVIRSQPQPVTYAPLYEAFPTIPQGTVRSCVHRLATLGAVQRVRRGVYQAVTDTPPAKKKRFERFTAGEAILDVIRSLPRPATRQDIRCRFPWLSLSGVSLHITRLTRQRKVVRVGRNQYSLAPSPAPSKPTISATQYASLREFQNNSCVLCKADIQRCTPSPYYDRTNHLVGLVCPFCAAKKD